MDRIENVTIRLRRRLKADWLSENPILSSGEPVFEKDSGKIKIGDGITRYSQLPYFVPSVPVPVLYDGSTDQDLLDHINSASPHPAYDDGPSLLLLYQNAKV